MEDNKSISLSKRARKILAVSAIALGVGTTGFVVNNNHVSAFHETQQAKPSKHKSVKTDTKKVVPNNYDVLSYREIEKEKAIRFKQVEAAKKAAAEQAAKDAAAKADAAGASGAAARTLYIGAPIKIGSATYHVTSIMQHVSASHDFDRVAPVLAQHRGGLQTCIGSSENMNVYFFD